MPYRKYSFESILEERYRKASYDDNTFESVNKRLDVLYDLLSVLAMSQLDDSHKAMFAKTLGYEPENTEEPE